jgi:hypothetical protein
MVKIKNVKKVESKIKDVKTIKRKKLTSSSNSQFIPTEVTRKNESSIERRISSAPLQSVPQSSSQNKSTKTDSSSIYSSIKTVDPNKIAYISNSKYVIKRDFTITDNLTSERSRNLFKENPLIITNSEKNYYPEIKDISKEKKRRYPWET